MIPAEIIAAAQVAQRKWRIPARVTVGQYGLESAWGKDEPIGSNNGFGIKAVKGMPYVLARTREEHPDGSSYYIVAPFEKFATIADAFEAHAKLIATVPVYASAMALLPDVNAFIREMAKHYATAHNYADELLSLIAVDRLAQYDVIAVAQPSVSSVSSSLSNSGVQQAPAVLPVTPTASPAGAFTGDKMTDFTPDPPVQLPSQATAILQQLGTHLGVSLGTFLFGLGAIQSNQETQLAGIVGGLVVWGASYLINVIAQHLRHQKAQVAVAVALATPAQGQK